MFPCDVVRKLCDVVLKLCDAVLKLCAYLAYVVSGDARVLGLTDRWVTSGVQREMGCPATHSGLEITVRPARTTISGLCLVTIWSWSLVLHTVYTCVVVGVADV